MNYLECPECKSYNQRIDFPSGSIHTSHELVCNNCGHTRLISPTTAHKIVSENAMKNEFEDAMNNQRPEFERGVMQATLAYDSIEAAFGAISLGTLKRIVDDAIEKGMPLESEVFNCNSEAPVEGIRILFETEKVSPIECGSHIYPDKGFDILVDTHECPEHH